MVRTFTVKNDTTLQGLGTTLLDGRFGGAQADAAMARLMAFNPHADPQKLAAGTVLFVPDTPGLKTSAGTAPPGVAIDDLRGLLTSALSEAASGVKTGNAQRAAQRADLAAALKSDVFKRLTGDDRDLAQQVSDAQQAMANEESADKQAEETLTVMSRAALAALEQIGKLVG
jgi:hypothetical protein